MNDDEIKINEEVMDFETLITEGVETRIKINFDFPTSKGIVKTSAIIKPITSIDWNNALRTYSKDLPLFNVKILELGLLNSKGEPIQEELLKKIPTGVANELIQQIQDISGIKTNKHEQYELTKELLGF